ncbi:uncharacterized protein LOC116214627 [Punica granatum]|uniref:Uncharacterized protein LOC116214627 n=1 Tax=Punica granatum TaxID=22663 RepID=A0A6P8E7C1_PUNGR|nr:uncharacterized protein LOC116214627 [Punica granatum]
METGLGKEYGERFVRFVDDALMRSRDGMPRFRIFVNAEVAPHLDRWLGMALDCHVEELSINIMSDLPYSIPARVLSAEFIKSLTLTGGVKIDGISAVSLPSLRLLHLVYTLIDNQMLQRLLGGCPLLEDLSLSSCGLLSEIEVPNLHYLKRVTVAGTGPEIKVVSIKAPGLESFKLGCRCQYMRVQDIGLAVHVSPSVSCLELMGLDQTDELFCRFLSKFPLLESLILQGCMLLKRIRISNPLLKKISIENCDNLVDIRMDTPKLSSFYYEMGKTLPSIWTENSPYSCATGFEFLLWQDPTAVWFQEFQKFLDGCSTAFRCLESTVLLYEWDDEMEDEMTKKVVLSAPGIQYLKLVLAASQSNYPLILDGLFSACQPTTFLLRAAKPLLKYICDALANREENIECCSGEPRCWRHKLKDAKIERVGGIQHQGPLDCYTLFSLLPTLSSENEVCFRLRW